MSNDIDYTQFTYCGLCRHWRFLHKGEIDDVQYRFLPPIGVARKDCAKMCLNDSPIHPSPVMAHCYLGKCDIGAVDDVPGGKYIFCDEDYVEDGSCAKFELWEEIK